MILPTSDDPEVRAKVKAPRYAAQRAALYDPVVVVRKRDPVVDAPAADPEQEHRNSLEARREQTKARYENEMQRTIATQARVRQQAQAQRQKRRNTLAVGCTVAILASAIGATLATRPR